MTKQKIAKSRGIAKAWLFDQIGRGHGRGEAEGKNGRGEEKRKRGRGEEERKRRERVDEEEGRRKSLGRGNFVPPSFYLIERERGRFS